MIGKAIAYGAATVVNAIATGKGSAFGLNLKTKAEVELNNSGKITAEIKNFPDEDTKLIKLCAENVLKYFNLNYGAHIITESEIPIARGLKSSSVAANAVVLATVSALSKEESIVLPGDEFIINIGVDSAIKANVTITGAFDDACASYLGGLVVTDNKKRILVKRKKMPRLDAIIFVPDEKVYTKSIDLDRINLIRDEIELIWGDALRGNIYRAMKMNGILYSSVLRQNPEIIVSALEEGAISAGLSGTGPAVVALAKTQKIIKSIEKKWREFDGRIIQTKINNKKSHIIE
ncbi:MAG: shikimate kinase [Candidatus Altiarchaeales archaeon]|nr:MAG: shikimate kinase [Candidatus Altiarchaeales archaeon]RLI94869.1 MAG: shikimate kinase [Candidatus Altiarchaeales archaeon]RLI94972.1 MAG: shikimate kinase [Candidatus Altiarchaeales archaeon]HDO82089.1 shikimate kinase [Candidatus Altiarchaeales archaeon]HEX54738.1 shikimate kinase [Candidatus Altiarchaeales archaeon]